MKKAPENPGRFNVQFDYFHAFNDNGGAGTEYYDLYLEPKLTYDLGSLGLAGLKPYVSSRISLATTNPAYTNTNVPFHDTFVQPGLVYGFAVPGFGGLNFDAGWRFAKIDNVGTSGSKTTNLDINPYSELRLSTTYTLKF